MQEPTRPVNANANANATAGPRPRPFRRAPRQPRRPLDPDPLPARAAPAEATLACPDCGSPMVRRFARRGRNQGRYFWGCSEYPKCVATVSEA